MLLFHATKKQQQDALLVFRSIFMKMLQPETDLTICYISQQPPTMKQLTKQTNKWNLLSRLNTPLICLIFCCLNKKMANRIFTSILYMYSLKTNETDTLFPFATITSLLFLISSFSYFQFANTTTIVKRESNNSYIYSANNM